MCLNGVGEWETFYEGDPLETFDTLKQAQDFINQSVQKEFEDLSQ